MTDVILNNIRPAIRLSELLTPEQAAERLHVAPDTVRQYAQAHVGRLKSVKLGTSVYFHPDEIERYMQEDAGFGRPKNATKE